MTGGIITVPGPFASKEEPAKATSVVDVYIYVNVYSISNVCTVSQTFGCYFYIRAIWLKKPGMDDKWNPYICFMNAAEQITKEEEFCSRKSGFQGAQNGETVMQWFCKVRGVFMEKFELENYPFDVQPLQVVISTNRKINEVVLHEDCYMGYKSLLRRDFTVVSEFTLSEPYFRESISVTKNYSLLKMYFVGVRRWNHHIWNLFFPVFLLTSMSAVVFVVAAENVTERLSLILTLVLTSVAFKYVVSEHLPKISYLTLCDIYVLSSFVFMVLVAFENILAAVFDDPEEFDKGMRVVLTLIFVLYNVVSIVVAVRYIQKGKIYAAELEAGVGSLGDEEKGSAKKDEEKEPAKELETGETQLFEAGATKV